MWPSKRCNEGKLLLTNSTTVSATEVTENGNAKYFTPTLLSMTQSLLSCLLSIFNSHVVPAECDAIIPFNKQGQTSASLEFCSTVSNLHELKS